MATATPPAHRGPDGAEAARRVARGGRAATCRQNPPPPGHGAEGPCLGVASLHPGHLRGTRPRTREPGRTLIPGDGAAGDQGGSELACLPACLPAWRWRLRDACGLSRLNDFLAPWSQAHPPSCNRHVTPTSVHMARPGPHTTIIFGSNNFRSPILYFSTRLIRAGAWNAYLPVLLPGRLRTGRGRAALAAERDRVPLRQGRRGGALSEPVPPGPWGSAETVLPVTGAGGLP
jgi:hypothetical protein